jgi:hypothetical protein
MLFGFYWRSSQTDFWADDDEARRSCLGLTPGSAGTRIMASPRGQLISGMAIVSVLQVIFGEYLFQCNFRQRYPDQV